jgi:DNA-nicking Smr family endonuclease
MPRKRKRAREAQQRAAETAAPKPAPQVATALGLVLKQAGVTTQATRATRATRATSAKTAPRSPTTLAPPGPPPPIPVTVPPKAAAGANGLTTAELRMLNDAYDGAQPLIPRPARAKPIAEREIGARDPKRDAAANAQGRADELAARARLAALVSGGVRFKIRREDDCVEALRADTSPKLLARIQGKGFTPEASLDLHGLRAQQVEVAIERFVRTHHRRGARHLLLIVGKGLHSEEGVSVLAPAAVTALSQGLAAPWVIAFSTAHAVHGGTGALAVLLRD